MGSWAEPTLLGPQGFPQAAAAAECPAGDAAELRGLPQAAALAVVASLYQGEGPPYATT